MSRFNSVILDVDSTLSGIEGIDWLASLRGPEIQSVIATLTDEAMRGEITLDSIYKKRLEAVRPSRAEVGELSRAYVDNLAPFSKESIAHMRDEGVQIVLVSGGLREAILPLASEVGLSQGDVHAVPIFFTSAGAYEGFDERSVLAKQRGKLATVEKLAMNGPTLAVGDGMTDSEMRPAVDAFAAFTGFVEREPVIMQADLVIPDFRHLAEIVLA